MRQPSGAVLRARVTEVVNETLRDVLGRALSEGEVMDAIDRGMSDGMENGFVLDIGSNRRNERIHQRSTIRHRIGVDGGR